MLLCSSVVTLEVPEGVKWLKFNFKNEGFYVVHYEGGWGELTAALTSDPAVLTPEDRASLINNIFALCRYAGSPFTPMA